MLFFNHWGQIIVGDLQLLKKLELNLIQLFTIVQLLVNPYGLYLLSY
jgi:hypothetical protein